MPNYNPKKAAHNTMSGLPSPDAEASARSGELANHIHAEIAASGGSLPFSRFMEHALYNPALGYYSAGANQLGATGDFVTAPEISSLFGRCVATQVAELLEPFGKAGEILELGAGTGRLAADLLEELERLGQLPQRYLILELSGGLRARQQHALKERLPHLYERMVWLDQLPAQPLQGVILGNEVLDALTVNCFEIDDNSAHSLEVCSDNDNFSWQRGEPTAALSKTITRIEESLDQPFQPGYRSELCPHLGAWINSLADCLSAGAILLFDYGYTRAEYYHPERRQGTLVCHYRHRAHFDPLLLPGLQDITASVDFSAVAQAGTNAGLELAGYTTQAWFLMGTGLEQQLARTDPDDQMAYLKRIQELKTLTLPSEMGERFKAIALGRNLEQPLRGFTGQDLRNRL